MQLYDLRDHATADLDIRERVPWKRFATPAAITIGLLLLMVTLALHARQPIPQTRGQAARVGHHVAHQTALLARSLERQRAAATGESPRGSSAATLADPTPLSAPTPALPSEREPASEAR